MLFVFRFVSFDFPFVLKSKFMAILITTKIVLEVKFTTMFMFIVISNVVVKYIRYSHNFKENTQTMHAMFNTEIVAHLNFLRQGKNP
jgi:hypothetical protein